MDRGVACKSGVLVRLGWDGMPAGNTTRRELDGFSMRLLG